ncbi:hypothetical protein [Pengzhenrongella phosphoraccumulans]|uniref:hypothetical protein n=1 Tax=Pengzhenrongella phosphoraccumulans TaxID=3114394 RepID=UPI00388E547E
MTAAPPLAPVAVASPASLAATTDGGPVAPLACGAGGEVAALRAAAAALASAAAGHPRGPGLSGRAC